MEIVPWLLISFLGFIALGKLLSKTDYEADLYSYMSLPTAKKPKTTKVAIKK